MGMSATQARILSLVAQQSNLEYQGQQINQERSILSQQVSELYNSLLAMNVPTPPSTNEFTTIQYSGIDGATNFSLGTIIPEGNNYMVEIAYNEVGHSMTAQKGTLKVNPKTSDYVPANEDIASGKKGLTEEEVYNYFVQVSEGEDPVKIDETNVNTYFTKLEDGTYTFNGANGAQLMTAAFEYTVGDGYECMTFAQAENSGMLTTDANTLNGYLEGLRHAFPECADMSDDELKSNFMIYFTVSESGENIPHFIPETALKSSVSVGSGSGFVTAYDYEAGGRFTNTIDKHNCQLTFDAAGRITELKIPTSTDENGEPTSFKTIKLTAETVTDNVAYQEAFAQYEYEQYKYDKEQQEINIKTEKIQEQDRTLELRLQRLDTQRTQITTEMEALKKVLDENIEDSYKTFNG